VTRTLDIAPYNVKLGGCRGPLGLRCLHAEDPGGRDMTTRSVQAPDAANPALM
jgi:hypothetical protein